MLIKVDIRMADMLKLTVGVFGSKKLGVTALIAVKDKQISNTAALL